MYATPRYPASMRMRKGICIHGVGPAFVKKISNRQNTVLRRCCEMFDHADARKEDMDEIRS